MKKFAEPWLQIGKTKIYGEDITAYHKLHHTASYHCINCGGPIGAFNLYPCPHCAYVAEDHMKSIKDCKY